MDQNKIDELAFENDFADTNGNTGEADFAHANEPNCSEDNDYAATGVDFHTESDVATYAPTLSSMATPSHEYEAAELAMFARPATRGNMLLGLIGAVIGALIGAAIWIFSRSFGYISYAAPIFIILLAFGGYRLGCNKKSAAGAAICIGASILAVLGGELITVIGIVSYAFADFGLTLADIMALLPEIFTIPGFAQSVYLELAIAIGAMAIGGIAIGVFSLTRGKKAAAQKMSDGTSTVEHENMELHDFEKYDSNVTDTFN